MNNWCKKGGATLIELIVILAVVGVLLALAQPRLTPILANRRLDAAARMLKSDLEELRNRAAARSAGPSSSESYSIDLSVLTNSYQLDFGGQSVTRYLGSKEMGQPDVRGVSIVSADLGATPYQMRFYYDGGPDEGGYIELGNEAGRLCYVVVEDGSGRVTISDVHP